MQIAHISEDWLIRAAQKVISWGEIQYPGSPCMRQTEKKFVQRECHRNPKQNIPRVRKRLQLLHCLTDLNTLRSKECVVCVNPRYNEKTQGVEAPRPGSSDWSMCFHLFSLPISLKSSGWRIRWSLEMTQSFVRSPIREFVRWRSVNLAASMVACTPAEPRTPREKPPSPASWRSNVGVFSKNKAKALWLPL